MGRGQGNPRRHHGCLHGHHADRQARPRAPRLSRKGSIYVVKLPRCTVRRRLAFADELFHPRRAAPTPANTVKLGIMDEECRTSVNLRAIAAGKRVAFINTGFLDRTGDEMHTSMEAGAMMRKGDIKNSKWIAAYERRNVLIGLAAGLRSRAQIGKGMWAMPDLMAHRDARAEDRPSQGGRQHRLGAVADRRHPACAALPPGQLAARCSRTSRSSTSTKGSRGGADDLLTIPVVAKAEWSETERQQELDNNCQGILGYVVRWVSRAWSRRCPDINDIGLMEDRATLRISSQHIANWLRHGVVPAEQVEATLERMAAVVDGQNAGDPPVPPDGAELRRLGGLPGRARADLRGLRPAERLHRAALHRYRQQFKAKVGA